ncbi:hypothetical protein K440DRAFT_645423 [Wilcoxina mikolae CBS 423.85]|nr:hypothetical protein K440DRAFT_645423 [Wilcoxina mikolae CBS 423.85]
MPKRGMNVVTIGWFTGITVGAIGGELELCMRDPGGGSFCFLTREWFITATTSEGSRRDEFFSVVGDLGSIVAGFPSSSGAVAPVIGLLFRGAAGSKKIATDISWFIPSHQLKRTLQLLSGRKLNPARSSSFQETPKGTNMPPLTFSLIQANAPNNRSKINSPTPSLSSTRKTSDLPHWPRRPTFIRSNFPASKILKFEQHTLPHTTMSLLRIRHFKGATDGSEDAEEFLDDIEAAADHWQDNRFQTDGEALNKAKIRFFAQNLEDGSDAAYWWQFELKTDERKDLFVKKFAVWIWLRIIWSEANPARLFPFTTDTVSLFSAWVIWLWVIWSEANSV